MNWFGSLMVLYNSRSLMPVNTALSKTFCLMPIVLLFIADAATLSKSYNLSSNVISHILSLHNNLRSSVANGTFQGQPPSSDMQALVYSASGIWQHCLIIAVLRVRVVVQTDMPDPDSWFTLS